MNRRWVGFFVLVFCNVHCAPGTGHAHALVDEVTVAAPDVVPRPAPTPAPAVAPKAPAQPNTKVLATPVEPVAPKEPVAYTGAQNDNSPKQTSDGIPRFVKLLPERYNRDELTLGVDQEFKLGIVVEHPQGLPVLLEALGLPPGAVFDPELHSITWRPTEAERGTYQVRLRATVGRAEASRLLILEVRGNQPPSIDTVWFEAVVGELGQWSVGAKDPEGGPVVVTARGLPDGASVDSDGNLSFQPNLGQVGEHEFELSASDGKRVTKRTAHIRVSAAHVEAPALEEWKSFWLPGVGYSFHTPRDAALGEVFHGLSLEIVMAAWIARNDNRGPSHGRVYVNAELLDSDVEATPLMFTYSAGLSLSFERNPARSWLIPFYGLELGGMVHKDFGGLFQTTPHLGLHLFSNPNVFVGARAGYRIVPTRIDSLAGLHASVTADLTIW